MPLHYLEKTRKHEKRIFLLQYCINGLSEFNQSLHDFFNIANSQLLFTMTYDSMKPCNVINWVQLWVAEAIPGESLLLEQYCCQNLSKPVDMCWSYSVLHHCLFWNRVISSRKNRSFFAQPVFCQRAVQKNKIGSCSCEHVCWTRLWLKTRPS